MRRSRCTRSRTLRSTFEAARLPGLALTILGTFMTRSGIVQSVHAFAESSVGPFLISGIAIVVAVSGALIVYRLPELRSKAVMELHRLRANRSPHCWLRKMRAHQPSKRSTRICCMRSGSTAVHL